MAHKTDMTPLIMAQVLKLGNFGPDLTSSLNESFSSVGLPSQKAEVAYIIRIIIRYCHRQSNSMVIEFRPNGRKNKSIDILLRERYL
jgi:hypothetical protein